MQRITTFGTTMCILFTVSAVAFAQPKKEKLNPGDEMIYKYLCAETDKLSAKVLDGAKTLEEWQQKRPRLYKEYLYMLGLDPLPEKTPLKATITGQVEAHGVVVEKLHFQSKPGLYVTANLYRPKALNSKQRLPAILYVCGHAGRGRDGNKSAYQDHGFWFANNGYVCLTLDTLQLGEIPGVHHGTYGRPWLHLKSYGSTDEAKMKLETRWWWHSAGYTPAGVEAWNGVRGIDYLLSRPEVDPDKIGVTGISGGGAATFWIAAADDRVKVAVPVSGMSDLECYVKNKVINGHCDCMFLYNTFQWEWTTIAALIAPRPLLFANSDNDGIFPMDGNRRIIARLRELYKMYQKVPSPPGGEGKGEGLLVDDYVSVGGHAYRPDLRIAIFKFINKHLKGDTTTPVEDSEKYKPLPGKELRVFATDDDIPKDAINHKIDETFVPRGKVELPEKGKFAEWKDKLLKKLRKNSFSFLPDEIPEANLVVTPEGILGNTKRRVALFLEENDYDRIKNLDKLSGPFFREGDDLFVLFPRFFLYPEEIKNKRGQIIGRKKELSWTRKSPPNFVERSHLLLGQTIEQRKIYFFVGELKNLNNGMFGDPGNWVVVGQGQSGILAAYAALFEPSIKEVVIIDPPKSHKEGPHFLNVLRVLDIPEALGLLAPTPLTIIGGKDAAFDRTAEIYRLAGAADKLTRK